MTHAIADQFTTVTSSGWSATTKLMQATAVGGANSVATLIRLGAASTGNATFQLTPEAATATAVNIPAAPATWSGKGWVSPVLDGANVHAVTTDTTALTIALLCATGGWTTPPTLAWTAILYLGEPNGGPITEIGRATSALAAAGTFTWTVTPGAAVSSGASTSPRLCIELFCQLSVAVGGLGNNDVSLATAGTTARLSTGGAYTSQWTRSAAVSGTGTVQAVRGIATARAFAVSGTGSPAAARRLTAAKSFGVSGTGSPAASNVLSAKRSAAVSATGTVALGPRTLTKSPIAVSATGSVAAARRIAASRSFAVSGTGTVGFARSLIFGRTFAVTGTGTPSMRIELPQAALNRISSGGPVDYPVTNPTKAVAGVTRNSAGAVVGGCTVYLIRQSDGLRCQTQVSNATTGAYSFPRDTSDPYNYRVLAVLAGSPETHGVTDLLVPA